MNNLSPFFSESKTTGLFAGIRTAQRSLRCRDFELQFFDCLQAYGVDNYKSQVKCNDYLEDFYECLDAQKAAARWRMMVWKRQKEYILGKRTKEDYYPEGTLDGSYLGAKPVH
ncbi:UNVERIFIED_CONTAM: hypothetical protein RMT77_006744 [Armadillidium vulgare]|nr:hypothetical protein Avbf_00196 [Armadillidium vulgare]